VSLRRQLVSPGLLVRSGISACCWLWQLVQLFRRVVIALFCPSPAGCWLPKRAKAQEGDLVNDASATLAALLGGYALSILVRCRSQLRWGQQTLVCQLLEPLLGSDPLHAGHRPSSAV